MKRKNSIPTVGACLLLLALALPQAYAFIHPGAPLTSNDLATLKANLNTEPWKSGYAALAADGRSQLTYAMRGPFARVSRQGAYDANLAAWRSDMVAIWNLSRMWYFTGDTAYAQKAQDILLAWANTQIEFSGRESMLDLGDYAYRFVGGAEILRGTWPGWTDADTTIVKSYFGNVLLPATNPYGESQFGAANKGALALVAGGLLAIFNDDAARLDKIVYQVRTLAHIGLRNSNDIGLLGDSLRDQGHAHGQLFSLLMLAEALWKQGIDIYSDLDHRLLAAGEYFARVNDLVPTPFLPFGTTDAYYLADNTNRGWGGGNVALNLIHGAYVVRQGLPAPYTMLRRHEMPVDADSFMFHKAADTSMATPAAALPFPAATSLTSGLTDVEIGDAIPAGATTYSGGTWTVQGGGREMWGTTNDSCHFAYQAITGDCAIVAKVESVQNTSISAKAGVMMRTSLSQGAPRAWMAVTPRIQFEQNIQGLAVYGGTNYSNKAYNIPSTSPSYWVKLERLGNIVTGYVSPDGTNWAATDVGRFEGTPPATLYVGLMVCSIANGTLNTSTFSNVQITGGDGAAPVVTPAAPAALLAAPGNSVVPLRWQSSFGATSYTVSRATSSGGPYSAIASGITASSYADTSVTNGMTYYYVVTASNSAGTSGPSPEDSARPVSPMVNLAFGGTTLANINDGSGKEGSDKAFDGNPGSKWFGYAAPTGWIQYDFGAGHARVVTRYSITSANDTPTRDPKSWNFSGSQDGISWTLLDSRSDETFATRYRMNVYDIANTTAYRFYRLEITANNGATGVQLSELGLWGDQVPATIVLSDPAATYDGTLKTVTATVAPPGVPLLITYNGSTTAPTNAGSYAVAATVADARFTGSATGTLTIAKAPVPIALSPLVQAYDGTPKTVTATTSPAGLTVNVTYDGAAAAPIYPGPHTVVATIHDANYAGTATATLDLAITSLVRHAPSIDGILDGSVQVLLPESVALNGNTSISGDLLVPGTPALVLNGEPSLVGAREGPGAIAPTSHTVTLNSGSVLRHLVSRVDPIALPVVPAPAAPTGTRSVTLNNGNQSVGDFATLRDLTLYGNAGAVAIPAGTYGNFAADGNAGFVLGIAGATQPANYQLQSLALYGNAALQVVGPVILTLAKGVEFNVAIGNAEHPTWLVLRVVDGDVTLNGIAEVHGMVIVPTGTVTLNGAAIRGSVVADRLVLNGNALLEEAAP